MAFVVRGGGLRRTPFDRFLVNGWDGCRAVELRRESKDRLWARVRERRSVARKAAVTSGEGGSPKMKNLMNAPMRITTESWPRRRPCVKERLGGVSLLHPEVLGTYEDSDLGRGTFIESGIPMAVSCGRLLGFRIVKPGAPEVDSGSIIGSVCN